MKLTLPLMPGFQSSATLGSLDRYRIAVEDDPQLNAALGLFPKAQALMASVPVVADKKGAQHR